MCNSPVENLMGIHTFFLMVDVEEPSNILRGISVSRYEGDSLLYITNDSFTKLCDDPESSNVWNCNNQFPWRQESPQGPADLGSAIGLAPQSPGLLGGLRDGTGVS